MAAKKTSKGFTPPKGMPQLKPASKPTEAIVAPGQKAKGLGKSTKDNRFESNAKTPVKQAGKGFAGSGAPVGTSIAMSQPTKASNVANALLAVTALPGSGQVKKAIAAKVGSGVESVGRKVLLGPLAKATGAGGKVSKTMTPFGPTLRSTNIGSAAQKAARMGGLAKAEGNKAASIGAETGAAVLRGMNKAGKVVREGVGTAAAIKASKPKKKQSK
jgi:hypothetical protein